MRSMPTIVIWELFLFRGFFMSDTAIATLVTMVQTLPDGIQDRILELVKEYITTIQDEMQWTTQFESSQSNLIKAAHRI
jgi:hypothetical protein